MCSSIFKLNALKGVLYALPGCWWFWRNKHSRFRIKRERVSVLTGAGSFRLESVVSVWFRFVLHQRRNPKPRPSINTHVCGVSVLFCGCFLCVLFSMYLGVCLAVRIPIMVCAPCICCIAGNVQTTHFPTYTNLLCNRHTSD